MLNDYKFNYVNFRDIKLITFYYKTLYSVITKEKNIDLKNLIHYSDLFEFLRNILSGECEYIFTRGKYSGKRCDQPAQRYYSHYFCNSCIKKAVVKMQIEESRRRFNNRRKLKMKIIYFS